MGTRGMHEPSQDIHSFSPRSGATVTVGPATDVDVDMDAPHAPYRPPEAVIEPEEENPPPYPPGVVAEHIGEDDDVAAVSSSPLRERISSSTLAGTDRGAWQDGMQDSYGPDTFKSDSMERPQLGPGVLPRRWLALVHEHELVQPDIHELPQPAPKRPLSVQSTLSEPPLPGSPAPLSQPPAVSDDPSTSAHAPVSPVHPIHRSSTTSLPDYEHICTISDVHDALPGGQESRHEWYFCKTCWSWFRIVAGRGQHPQVDDMETWRRTVQDRADQEPRYRTIANSPGAFNTAFTERAKSWTTLNDVLQSRNVALLSEHHLHELPRLVHPSDEKRIERITVPDELDAFPHITMGAWDDDPVLSSFPPPTQLPILYLSCSSDLWLLVEQGPAGQLPSALVKAFTAEKMSNPSPGLNGENSVNEAWTLLLT
jgi:ubiquitin carboxyl-terminal hydrolase 25/28